jgi:4-amino-4-deoxy-L-arabinose transferase-like glycosyltransferase
MAAAIAPILIALASFVLRLINLGSTKGYIFDEVYYVDGARDLLKYGVEVSGSAPEFIVHPPVGKWLIGAGIAIFGDNEFGWRFATALIGTLLIFCSFSSCAVLLTLVNRSWCGINGDGWVALSALSNRIIGFVLNLLYLNCNIAVA